MSDYYLLKCSQGNCPDYVESYCNCDPIKYWCGRHRDQHHTQQQNSGNSKHKTDQVYVDVSNKILKNYIGGLRKKIHYYDTVSRLCISRSHELITLIAQQEAEKIKFFYEKIDAIEEEIQQAQETSKIFYQNLDNFNNDASEFIVDENKYNIQGIVSQLKYFFEFGAEDAETALKTYRRNKIYPLVYSIHADTKMKLKWLSTSGINIDKSSSISHFIVSYNGELAIICENSKKIKYWSLISNEKIHEFIPYINTDVTCLEITQEAKYVVTANREKSVNVWDVKKKELTIELIHDSRIQSMLVTNNNLLITSSWNSALKIWKMNKLDQPIKEYTKVHTISIYGSITYTKASNNGILLASGGYDGRIKVFDIEKAEQNRNFEYHVHRQAIKCLAFTSNNYHLISGSEDKLIVLWNLNSGVREAIFNEHKSFILAIMISNDDKSFASAGEDNKVIIFNIQETRRVLIIEKQKDLIPLENTFPEIQCFSKYLKS